jgi:hypothetical protein
MTLQHLHYEFPYTYIKFYFIFYQCVVRLGSKINEYSQLNLKRKISSSRQVHIVEQCFINVLSEYCESKKCNNMYAINVGKIILAYFVSFLS